jgi:7SK snRNA methylphosphate capping enzyme
MSEDVSVQAAAASSNVQSSKQRSKQRRPRKRSHWQSDGEGGGKQVEGTKRKKRKLSKRKSEQVGHKFLIGGDISDPLNLKTDDLPGVDDIEVSDDSQQEHQNTIPTVPNPQTDPLQLEDPEGIDHKTKKKQKRKRKRLNSETKEETKPKQPTDFKGSAITTKGEVQEDNASAEAANGAVVIASGSSKSQSIKSSRDKPSGDSKRGLRKEQRPDRFRFGNYNRYYGYRNPCGIQDERLKYMKLEWFEGKKCLDIGCNVGHFTLSIARDFKPKLIVGLDIDNQLIAMAKKNIRHYLSPLSCEVEGKQVEFPLSIIKSFGPIAGYPLPVKGNDAFPNNVEFKPVSSIVHW